MAIRRNIGQWEKMQRQIWAILYHLCEVGEVGCSFPYDCHRHDGGKKSTDSLPFLCASSADERHSVCPEGALSWCRWQRARATGTPTPNESADTLPHAFFHELNYVFRKMSAESLLRMCESGNTQNAVCKNLIKKIVTFCIE